MAALAVAVLLSGCGIRDTALPVDAGEGASRTACPPTSGASLSQLEGEAFPSPSSGGGLTTIPWASLAPAAPVTPTTAPASPQPTDSDGTLSCLSVSPSASTSPAVGSAAATP
jgi:hypothetical protein